MMVLLRSYDAINIASRKITNSYCFFYNLYFYLRYIFHKIKFFKLIRNIFHKRVFKSKTLTEKKKNSNSGFFLKTYVEYV